MKLAWKIKRFAPKVTKTEMKLRRALTKVGIPFQTQVILQGKERRHCVDFYLAPHLIVEVDGASHRYEKQKIKDELATADLENAELPFTVLRVKDGEVWNNLDAVVDAIRKLMKPNC